MINTDKKHNSEIGCQSNTWSCTLTQCNRKIKIRTCIVKHYLTEKGLNTRLPLMICQMRNNGLIFSFLRIHTCNGFLGIAGVLIFSREWETCSFSSSLELWQDGGETDWIRSKVSSWVLIIYTMYLLTFWRILGNAFTKCLLHIHSQNTFLIFTMKVTLVAFLWTWITHKYILYCLWV